MIKSSCDVDDHEKGWCDHSNNGNVGDVTETDLSEWNDIVDAYTVATFDQATHDAWELLGTTFPLSSKTSQEQ
jgi:hypothetical protein